MAKEHIRDTIPENSVVTMEVEIIGYIAPGHTEQRWAMRTEGDAPVSTFLGHLELAKHELHQRIAGE